MPDISNAKDQHINDQGGTDPVKASVKRVKSGKVVDVRSQDRNVDPMVESLKQEKVTIPLVAVPGKFPNGRAVPGSKKVQKAEAKRQDAELLLAQKEVEALKQQLAAATAPPPADPQAPANPSAFGYGDGTGQVHDSGGFSGFAPKQ